jgi:hypothetical protein
VLKILADHQDELHRQFGVKSLALFGSVARAEAMETRYGKPTWSSGELSCQSSKKISLQRQSMSSKPRKWKFRIRHILEALAENQSYVSGVTYEEFC